MPHDLAYGVAFFPSGTASLSLHDASSGRSGTTG